MLTFLLMHRNTEVAEFSVDNGEIVSTSIYCVERLPVGCNNGLKQWLRSRTIPATRDYIGKDLSRLGNPNTINLMLWNNGVSLTDHYWVKPVGFSDTWETVNAYTNVFNSVYSVSIADDILSVGSFNPSATVNGDMRKKWVVDNNGVRRLLKCSSGISCRQVLCEVLASSIYEMQGIVHTPYSLVEIRDSNDVVLGCECSNFTTEYMEFIPAIGVVNSEKKRNSESYYEHYINVCGRHGLDVRYYLEVNILVNFVISNLDWHLSNIGVLRNSKTLEWVSPAPIFDSGNSMFYNMQSVPTGKRLLDLRTNSFYSKEVTMLKHVRNRNGIDVRLLPSDEVVYGLLSKDIQISSRVTELLVRAYREKILLLSDYQNGANIWDYRYQRGIL